eukprot:3943796-Amphidinium_carterae.1
MFGAGFQDIDLLRRLQNMEGDVSSAGRQHVFAVPNGPRIKAMFCKIWPDSPDYDAELFWRMNQMNHDASQRRMKAGERIIRNPHKGDEALCRTCGWRRTVEWRERDTLE